MNINRALKISGYSSDAHRDERISELLWLAERASEHTRIVEVGSWCGHSMLAIADNMPEDGIAWAVDTWRDTPDMFPYNDRCKDDPDFLFKSFCQNIGEVLLSTQRVRTIRMRSVDAAEFLVGIDGQGTSPLLFDMIFIDAAHDYDNVKADILAWQKHLAPSGLLAGHDYWHPGVVRAVNELLPTHVKTGVGSIWMVPPCQK